LEKICRTIGRIPVIFYAVFQSRAVEISSQHRRALFASLLAIVLLAILLQVPGNPKRLGLEHWLRLPLEVPFAVLVLLYVRGRALVSVRLIFIALIVALLLLRMGDMMSRIAFGRAFNPLVEWHLIGQGWTLTAKTIGKFEAVAWLGAGLLLLILLGILLYRCFGAFAQLSASTRLRTGIISAIVLAVSGTMWYVQENSKRDFHVEFVSVDEVASRVKYIRKTIKDQLKFSALLESDKVAESKPQFDALQGHDVIVLFVESYGRSFIDHKRFAEQAASRLDAVEQEVTAAGVGVKSGWIKSPIRGGRSWLAHGTLASGLSLTSHARFDRLITSPRKSLHGLFKDAGWTTAVVLPVVSKKWVEGAWYQVDHFFDRDALDYQGHDFGYVTMPDQYMLTAFEKLIREPAEKPLFAHIGLLDSHAPWGPLPEHLPWDEVGDGSVFDGTRRYGDRHSWAYPKPVRKAYGVAVEQNLKLIGEYIARHAQDALFIVVGDHQPASIIAGWAPSSEVPMHVFSTNTELLERLPETVFTSGMRPLKDSDSLLMADVREMLATQFDELDTYAQK